MSNVVSLDDGVPGAPELPVTGGNVVGLPVPEPERYVTRTRLAEMMGVSVKTIDRLVAQGMPSETWGLRARRFRPSVAMAWARTQTHQHDQAA